jgi:PAS domain-containing protein
VTDSPRRVCERCESGVLLGCRRDALAPDAAALLVCTYELEITAISEAAELFLGEEDEVVGKPLLELVTCPLGDDQLARHVALAAQRPREPEALPLRPREGDGVGTLAARVATCGPPRAALLTLEPSRFGRRQ